MSPAGTHGTYHQRLLAALLAEPTPAGADASDWQPECVEIDIEVIAPTNQGQHPYDLQAP